MTCYSVQSRYRIFEKGYYFGLLLKIWATNIDKTWSDKYSQKLLDHSKQSATEVRKTSEAASDLIVNKLFNKATQI